MISPIPGLTCRDHCNHRVLRVHCLALVHRSVQAFLNLVCLKGRQRPSAVWLGSCFFSRLSRNNRNDRWIRNCDTNDLTNNFYLMLKECRHCPGRRRPSLINTPSLWTHGHFARHRLARAMVLNEEEVKFTFGWWLNKNYELGASNIWCSLVWNHDKIFTRFLVERDESYHRFIH